MDNCPPTGEVKMSNTYKVSTQSTLFNSAADWSVTLDDEQHMMQYQVYANTLVAAVVAKLGEYALDLVTNPDALAHGAKSLARKIADS
jgi:hypothetical protein